MIASAQSLFIQYVYNLEYSLGNNSWCVIIYVKKKILQFQHGDGYIDLIHESL